MRLVFALIFLVGGLALTAYGFLALKDAQASGSWPYVEGQIVESKIRKIHTSKQPKDNTSRRKYAPSITYRYVVDGQSYEANNLSYGEGPSNSESKVQKVVAKYPNGSSHRIYYKPSKPGTAVLEPGMKFQAWFLPVFGLVLLLFGFFGLIGSIKRKGRAMD